MRIGMIVTTVLQAASIGERSARDRLPRTTLLAISNYPFDLTGSYCIAMHSKESIPLFSIRGFSLAEGDHFSGSVVQNHRLSVALLSVGFSSRNDSRRLSPPTANTTD